MNQVARDEQLLDITKDYLQFVTTFFEAINVSAAHIYHSALELSPVSSVIRKQYYHRRITHWPKVVIGTPEEWDQSVAVSGKDSYHGLCTWSPCGRFVAAQTRSVAMAQTRSFVEIRDQLTLELITVLQPTETAHNLVGPLAYSPDGCSISGASDTAIIIWDIQTGGVAEEIECSAKSVSLVWSSDGGTICTTEPDDPEPPFPLTAPPRTYGVHTYNISSGTTSSPGTLKSRGDPYLWVHDKSFWIMTMQDGYSGIDIFEVGPTLTKIHSFDFSPSPSRYSMIGSFSPTTHRVSILGPNLLRIFDTQNSNLLLDVTGNYYFCSHCFSSDGNLFAASQDSGVHIWKYASGCYTPCGGFESSRSFRSLRFSPTPSSILGHSEALLQVFQLHELPTTPKTHHEQYVGLSRSGTRIATAHKLGNTVTIIDLLAQSPPQFIDTDVEIGWLDLTDNVLLVADSREVVAWLLTEDGLVDGVIGDRRVGRRDSIWTISEPELPWERQFDGQVGVIKLRGNTRHVYHTKTGEVLHHTQAGRYHTNHQYYYNIFQPDTLPKYGWQTSWEVLEEGWVTDPKGKYRLWLPAKWRDGWFFANYYLDPTTQFNLFEEGPVIIKF